MKRAGNEGVSGWNETWEYRLELNVANGQTTHLCFSVWRFMRRVLGISFCGWILAVALVFGRLMTVENQISLNNSLWYFLSYSQFPIHSSHQWVIYTITINQVINLSFKVKSETVHRGSERELRNAKLIETYETKLNIDNTESSPTSILSCMIQSLQR